MSASGALPSNGYVPALPLFSSSLAANITSVPAASAAATGGSDFPLGSQCVVRLPEQHHYSPTRASVKPFCVVQGSLLEVRRLWIPPQASHASDREEGAGWSMGACDGGYGEEGPLYAFVRLKDTDHRLSGWFPLCHVELKGTASAAALSAASSNFSASSTASPNDSHCNHHHRDVGPSLHEVATAPVLSSIYKEVTSGMARTQRAMKQLDYLEERLLRDYKTPTTIRFFSYLAGTFVFAPWYYAPYGLLNPEYDPLIPVAVRTTTTSDENGGGDSFLAFKAAAEDVGLNAPDPTAQLRTNPFIRDAFLCPFSLRVFSTFEQLRYETQMYRHNIARQNLLRPPGTEVYRDEDRGLSVFEVNGSRNITYCRHLFLIGKSFLENKLASHDVHNYIFYVVGLHQKHFPRYIDDPTAIYFAGFFTWEKQVVDYNLACIVTLPCFAGGGPQQQQQQPSSSVGPASNSTVPRNIGQFMIALSYELAYRRGHVGSPEKPLSDLGAAAYERYWRRCLVRWMCETALKKKASRNGKQHEAAVAEHHSKGKGKWATVESQPRKRARKDVIDVDGSQEIEEENCNEDTDEIDESSDGEDSDDVQTTATSRSYHHHWGGGDGAEEGEDEEYAEVSIEEIAKLVSLEEADVLKTMLGMGLLHRSAEDRSIRLLVPRQYVEWELRRLLELQGSRQHAVFVPAKLKTKVSALAAAKRRASAYPEVS